MAWPPFPWEITFYTWQQLLILAIMIFRHCWLPINQKFFVCCDIIDLTRLYNGSYIHIDGERIPHNFCKLIGHNLQHIMHWKITQLSFKTLSLLNPLTLSLWVVAHTTNVSVIARYFGLASLGSETKIQTINCDLSNIWKTSVVRWKDAYSLQVHSLSVYSGEHFNKTVKY